MVGRSECVVRDSREERVELLAAEKRMSGSTCKGRGRSTTAAETWVDASAAASALRISLGGGDTTDQDCDVLGASDEPSTLVAEWPAIPDVG